jgi:tyrosyl-tRNA synthetase
MNFFNVAKFVSENIDSPACFERAMIASKKPPSEWPEFVVWPVRGSNKSIFEDKDNRHGGFARNHNQTILEALVETGLCKSLSEARRAINGNAISIATAGGKRTKVTDANLVLNATFALPNLDCIVLEAGRYNYGIVEMWDAL